MKKTFFAILSVLSLQSVFAYQKVVALREKTPLRLESSKTRVEWAAEIPMGTELALVDKKVYIRDLVTKRDINHNQEFLKVNYDGQEYFVNKTEVTSNLNLTITLDDAKVYAEPDLQTYKNVDIPRYTIIAVTGNKAVSEGITFAQVEYYDKPTWRIKTRWIKADLVSKAKGDIKAVALIKISDKEKNPETRKAILEPAINLSKSPTVEAEVNRRLKIKKSESKPQKTRELKEPKNIRDPKARNSETEEIITDEEMVITKKPSIEEPTYEDFFSSDIEDLNEENNTGFEEVEPIQEPIDEPKVSINTEPKGNTQKVIKVTKKPRGIDKPYTTFELQERKSIIVSKEGNEVIMKTDPGFFTPSVTTLKNHSSIRLIARTNEKDSIEGKTDFWYKVKYKENKIETTGWVFGGNIL